MRYPICRSLWTNLWLFSFRIVHSDIWTFWSLVPKQNHHLYPTCALQVKAKETLEDGRVCSALGGRILFPSNTAIYLTLVKISRQFRSNIRSKRLRGCRRICLPSSWENLTWYPSSPAMVLFPYNCIPKSPDTFSINVWSHAYTFTTGVRTSVYTPRGKSHLGQHALNVATKVVNAIMDHKILANLYIYTWTFLWIQLTASFSWLWIPFELIWHTSAWMTLDCRHYLFSKRSLGSSTHWLIRVHRDGLRRLACV